MESENNQRYGIRLLCSLSHLKIVFNAKPACRKWEISYKNSLLVVVWFSWRTGRLYAALYIEYNCAMHLRVQWTALQPFSFTYRLQPQEMLGILPEIWLRLVRMIIYEVRRAGWADTLAVLRHSQHCCGATRPRQAAARRARTGRKVVSNQSRKSDRCQIQTNIPFSSSRNTH